MESQRRELREVAAAEGVTESEVLRTALTLYFADWRKRQQKRQQNKIIALANANNVS